MVLAIAVVLLLQPQPSLTGISTGPSTHTSTGASAANAFVSTPSSAVTAQASEETETASTTGAEATAIHWNLDAVKFDTSMNLDRGDKGTAKVSTLTDGSLGDTQKQGVANLRIPDPEPAKPIPMTPAETLHPSRAWLALSFAQSSAAAFDAYSTRQAIGHGAVERDPLLRPFAHSGAIYGAIQVGPVILDYVARRMQRSENNLFRRTWWAPQSLATAGFIFSGVHNMNVSNRLAR
jgi:hypothetical protein